MSAAPHARIPAAEPAADHRPRADATIPASPAIRPRMTRWIAAIAVAVASALAIAFAVWGAVYLDERRLSHYQAGDLAQEHVQVARGWAILPAVLLPLAGCALVPLGAVAACAARAGYADRRDAGFRRARADLTAELLRHAHAAALDRRRRLRRANGQAAVAWIRLQAARCLAARRALAPARRALGRQARALRRLRAAVRDDERAAAAALEAALRETAGRSQPRRRR